MYRAELGLGGFQGGGKPGWVGNIRLEYQDLTAQGFQLPQPGHLGRQPGVQVRVVPTRPGRKRGPAHQGQPGLNRLRQPPGQAQADAP